MKQPPVCAMHNLPKRHWGTLGVRVRWLCVKCEHERHKRRRKNAKPSMKLKINLKRVVTLHGITVSDWVALWTAQQGKCASCEQALFRPQVDHDHDTGQVRGLLCFPCNVALGCLKDDPNKILALYRYKMRSV